MSEVFRATFGMQKAKTCHQELSKDHVGTTASLLEIASSYTSATKEFQVTFTSQLTTKTAARK